MYVLRRTLGLLVLALIVSAGLAGSAALAQVDARGAAELKARWWAEEPPAALASWAGGETLDMRSDSAAPDDYFASWSRIAFESWRDGNWEIYLARGDGTAPVRLTYHDAVDSHASLTRGGERVAFDSGRAGSYDIYKVNADGTGLRALTTNGESNTAPAWSPDGRSIAYASNYGGNWEIWVMNADGSDQRQLTVAGAVDITPKWSPDGRQIVWIRRGQNGNAIWAMNADGSGQRAVTAELRFGAHPTWSPDGSLIAFDYDADGDYWNEAALVRADGTGAPWVVFDAGQALTDVWIGSWSPDGEWLLFTRVLYIVQGNVLYYLNMFSEQVRLTDRSVQRLAGSGYDMRPSWQTVDLQPPTARVSALPALSRASGFTVNWSGQDAGAAGIRGYEVQVRDGPAGAWTAWITSTADVAARFVGLAGHGYGFRARAWDRALNRQAWQGIGADAQTSTYSAQVAGVVRDVRDRPIVGATVAIQPAAWLPTTSGPDGGFAALLKQDGMHALTVSRPGYGMSRPLMTSSVTDTVVNLGLPPALSMLSNNDFEAGGWGVWTAGGNVTPTLQADAALTGAAGVFMGQEAADYPPAVNVSQSSARKESNFADIKFDPSGTLHVVWTIFYSETSWQPARLGYAACAADRPCDPPVTLPFEGLMPQLASGPDGRMHMVWVTANEGALMYAVRSTSGVWSTPETVAGIGANVPAIVVDSKGTPHVVWASYGVVLVYAQRLANGTWATETAWGQGQDIPTLAVGPDDTVHLIWAMNNYRERSPAGVWSPLRGLAGIISDPDGIEWLGMSVDRQRGVHIVVADRWDHGIRYAYRAPNGQWMPTQTIPGLQGKDPKVIVRDDGLIAVTAASDDGVSLAYRYTNGVWTSPRVVMTTGFWPQSHLAFSPTSGQLAVAGCSSKYGRLDVLLARFLPQVEVAGESVLAQTLSTRPDFYAPTLSLFYQYAVEGPAGSDHFVVSVDDGMSRRDLAELPPAADWSHVWFDLQEWRGRPITVTLRLSSTGVDGRFAYARLDDVTLSPWLTPGIESVTPTRVSARGGSQVVAIVGENFTRAASVRLNDIAAAGVRWLDAHTLEATLPAGLAAGVYDVWVANPGGQSAVAPAGLRVSWLVTLPMVRK